MKKLSVAEQRKLIQSLPNHRLNLVKKHCEHCQMKGEGIGDIVKSVGKVLGPVVKEFGPTILKELVAPYIKKKIAQKKNKKGGGLAPAGGALKLAGVR